MPKSWRHFVGSEPPGSVYLPVTHAREQADALNELKGLWSDVDSKVVSDVSRVAARAEIRAAVRKCNKGDQLFISFLGHGVAGPPDGTFGPSQEYWLFTDGGLCDLTLLYELTQLAPGAQAVVLSDACKGGGMFGNWLALLALAAHNRGPAAARPTSTAHPPIATERARFPCPRVTLPSADHLTLLLISPVHKTLNTLPGFTRAFADRAGSCATYRELRDSLAQKWSDMEFAVFPYTASEGVLRSRPLDIFVS